MTNLETLKARIVKILPEIMNLEFGCIVKDRTGEWLLISKWGEGSKFKTVIAWNHTSVQALWEHEIEILGRPIQLEDILEAIQIIHKNKIGFFVNQYGIFYGMTDEEFDGSSMNPILIKYKNLGWIMSKPLSEQSPETISFLLEVIKE